MDLVYIISSKGVVVVLKKDKYEHDMYIDFDKLHKICFQFIFGLIQNLCIQSDILL